MHSLSVFQMLLGFEMLKHLVVPVPDGVRLPGIKQDSAYKGVHHFCLLP